MCLLNKRHGVSFHTNRYKFLARSDCKMFFVVVIVSLTDLFPEFLLSWFC